MTPEQLATEVQTLAAEIRAYMAAHPDMALPAATQELVEKAREAVKAAQEAIIPGAPPTAASGTPPSPEPSPAP
jgi:hypothetical protein